MSVEARNRHKKYLQDIHRTSGAIAEGKLYVEQMLAEVHDVLKIYPDDHQAFFILYFGLSVHGRWTIRSVAEHYAVDSESVLDVVKAITQNLPSDEHRSFVRRYSEHS